jgi:hypothetical protein
MKRIRDVLSKEGLIVDEAIKEIKERYGSIDIDYEALNAEINKFLFEHEISIPLPKIKLSQIEGIETVGDLETLEGIIEIDVTE